MSKLFFLADDDLDDQDMFIEAVKSIDKSFEVISAFDGQEAMQLLSGDMTAVPDFIFLDLNMPKLNGKLCLERIKQLPSVKKIPVIIYTTSSINNDIEETKRMGAAHFITKPSTFGDLQRMLSDVVNTDWTISRGL